MHRRSTGCWPPGPGNEHQTWLETLAHELEARGLALVQRTEIVVEIEDFLAESAESALDGRWPVSPKTDLAAELGISRQTVYHYLKTAS